MCLLKILLYSTLRISVFTHTLGKIHFLLCFACLRFLWSQLAANILALQKVLVRIDVGKFVFDQETEAYDQNHFAVLGVYRDSSDAFIKAVYKAKALEEHPNKNLHDFTGANAKMAIINEAYRVLSDPALKREHDAEIKRRLSSAKKEKKSSKIVVSTRGMPVFDRYLEVLKCRDENSRTQIKHTVIGNCVSQFNPSNYQYQN